MTAEEYRIKLLSILNKQIEADEKRIKDSPVESFHGQKEFLERCVNETKCVVMFLEHFKPERFTSKS